MPPSIWFALASILSAAIGAAIARAVGRAYRATGRSPERFRAAAASLPAASAPAVDAAPISREASARVTADAVRPGGGHRPRLAWADAIRHSSLARGLNAAPPELTLAVAAAVLYVVTRLWSIDTFPIFFYSDEVNAVLFGEQVYQRGLVGEDGSWPAVYALWDTNRWGPALPVYLQGLSAFLFGRHVWVARATEALASLGGVLAIALILKDHFRSRFWWASILLAAGIPAWFLYTRTAFCVAIAAGLFAVFLLAYFRYRYRSPASLGLAAVAGAAAFYSYSNTMVVVGVLAAALLIVDCRYHLQHRRIWLRTLPVLALLLVPFLQYRILHPDAVRANLSAVASYWVEDLPLAEKLLRYVQNYLQGLSPIYWFAPESGTGTLPTQFIPGAGHLGFAMLPLVGIGLVVAFRHLRSSPHRLILLSALVIPAGAAMDTVEIYRVLIMVVPALILAVLGLDQIGDWLKAIPRGIQMAAVAGVLCLLALARFIGSVVNGPTWSSDYGLQGTQFGAKVLYEDTIPALLAEDPSSTLVMNTTWGNNAHIYPQFFLSPADQERVRFGNVRDYLDKVLPLDPGTIIAMLPEEYADAIGSPMLSEVDVVKTVYRPNGEPGFYFAHIAYAANLESVIRELEAIRVQPVESQVEILGQPTTVLHSRLADGNIANLFDGSTGSLIRSDDVNPFLLEIRFTEPRVLEVIHLTTGSFGDFTVSLTVTLQGVEEPSVVSQRYRDLPPDPTVSLALPSAGAAISSLRLEVTDNAQGPTGAIHVREIVLE